MNAARLPSLPSLPRSLAHVHPSARLKPHRQYSMYFCSKCPDCMSLHYPFLKTIEEQFITHRSTCDHCEHGPMSHFCWWNKHVANPISRHGEFQSIVDVDVVVDPHTSDALTRPTRFAHSLVRQVSRGKREAARCSS